jgi:O-antigen/teichoic acid export membrane protein
VTSIILGIGSGVIVARVLGPERRGYYGLVVMACTLLFGLGHLGIGSGIAYYTGKKTFERNKILKFLVVSSLTIGTVVAALFFFAYKYIADIWSDIPRSIMLMGLVSVPFYFLYAFLERYLLASLRVKRAIITKVIHSFLYLILLGVFILVLRGGVKETVAVYTISFITSSLLALFLFTREDRPMAKLDLSLTNPMLSFGIRAYLIVVFNFLNYKLGVILVKHYLTVSDVAYFQIAAGIAQRFWYFPNAMSALLFPTLLAMESGSAEFSAKICRNNLFLMVILAIIAIFIARPVVLMLYGAEYETVIYALYSLLWGIVIFPFYKFLSSYFASQKMLGIGIFASAVGIGANIVANMILIPRYGVLGAGLASSISYSVLSFILLLFFRGYTKIRFREILIPNREDFRDYGKGIRRSIDWMKRRSSGKDNR